MLVLWLARVCSFPVLMASRREAARDRLRKARQSLANDQAVPRLSETPGAAALGSTSKARPATPSGFAALTDDVTSSTFTSSSGAPFASRGVGVRSGYATLTSSYTGFATDLHRGANVAALQRGANAIASLSDADNAATMPSSPYVPSSFTRVSPRSGMPPLFHYTVFEGFIEHDGVEVAYDIGKGAAAGYELFAGDGYFIVSDFGVDVNGFIDGGERRGSQTASG